MKIKKNHNMVYYLSLFVTIFISCSGNYLNKKEKLNLLDLDPCEIVDIFYERYTQGSFFIDKADSVKYMRNIHFSGDWGILKRMKEDSGKEVNDIMIEYYFKEENLYVQVRFYEQDYQELFLVNEILKNDSVYIVEYNKTEGCSVQFLPSAFKNYKISELEQQKKSSIEKMEINKYR
jgi:hypothetical protein